ncbi:MAG: hypothetical protein ACXABY_23755 [Candidatus Thorarchaeota archaeon]|jgi:hypothetical protein
MIDYRILSRSLSDEELSEILTDFIDLTVSVAVDMYANETAELPPYAVQFAINPILSGSTSTQTTSSVIPTTQSPTQPDEGGLTLVAPIAGVISAGLVITAGLGLLRRREIS